MVSASAKSHYPYICAFFPSFDERKDGFQTKAGRTNEGGNIGDSAGNVEEIGGLQQNSTYPAVAQQAAQGLDQLEKPSELGEDDAFRILVRLRNQLCDLCGSRPRVLAFSCRLECLEFLKAGLAALVRARTT